MRATGSDKLVFLRHEALPMKSQSGASYLGLLTQCEPKRQGQQVLVHREDGVCLSLVHEPFLPNPSIQDPWKLRGAPGTTGPGTLEQH